MRLKNRWKSLDFKNASTDVEAGFPFGQVKVWGISFRANPRISVGTRWIDGSSESIRDGQRAGYLSVSL